eukprot:10139846-Ditylum_brightwellii.AAC.1
MTKEQFFKYGCGVAGTKVTAKEPPEEPGRVDDSCPFLKAVDPTAWQEPPRCWEFDLVHDKHGFFSPDRLVMKCVRCVGKGWSKGIITLQRLFGLSRWNDHCSSTRYMARVANWLAENKIAKASGKNKKTQLISNMLSSFKTMKKTLLGDIAGIIQTTPSTVVIDVDADDDGT